MKQKKVIKICTKWLIIFGLSLFNPILYADDTGVCSDDGNKGIKVEGKIKSSAIPEKREYPVDETINPCVDFYKYACSPVMDSFQLRDDRSRHTFSFSDSSERLLEIKKKYFFNLAQKKPESDIEGEVKNYYLACMNQPGRQKEELAFVDQTKKILQQIATREQFVDMIAENITNSSRLSFIAFDASYPNLDRPKYNDLIFDVRLMSLPERSYYENKELTAELLALIEQFFIAIGEDEAKQKAQLVFDFEKEMAQYYPTPPEIQELFFSRTAISRDELINNYPNLKLAKFLSNIPKHVVIRNIIRNGTMEFLNRKLETASLEELKSVFLYFQLKSIMDDAYPDFFNKKFEFEKKYLGGPDKRSDRQERCTQSVMSSFGKEVDFILLPKVFPNFPKEKFIKSIEKIRTSLIEQLKSNAWLKDATKQEAIRKIAKAKLALVSPDNAEDWYFNPRTTYETDAPITNSHKLVQLLIDRQLQELSGPVNTNRWYMPPLTVNASYNPSYNRFEFPVGILQYPFYDPNEPEEVNLGAIGMVIGHELGHGIDNHGSGFNADGVLKTWMTDEDKKIFKERSQYLITQYNKACYSDKKCHNGEFTLGENIGDLVGLTTAYRAAFPSNSSKSQELKQKFFLQYARTWCEVARQGNIEKRLKTDPHALGEARTNEQVKHQVGFREAYSCKPTDPMVIPENEVVKIW